MIKVKHYLNYNKIISSTLKNNLQDGKPDINAILELISTTTPDLNSLSELVGKAEAYFQTSNGKV